MSWRPQTKYAEEERELQKKTDRPNFGTAPTGYHQPCHPNCLSSPGYASGTKVPHPTCTCNGPINTENGWRVWRRLGSITERPRGRQGTAASRMAELWYATGPLRIQFPRPKATKFRSPKRMCWTKWCTSPKGDFQCCHEAPAAILLIQRVLSQPAISPLKPSKGQVVRLWVYYSVKSVIKFCSKFSLGEI